MFYVGLTGGVAAGKSLTADFYRRQGAILLDSDLLARSVVDPSFPDGRRLLAALAREFGNEIIDPEGALDRAALAKKIFGRGKGKARRKLEHLLHPHIQKEAMKILATVKEDAIVVHDIPLLAETRDSRTYCSGGFDCIVTVVADRKQRVKRMVENRGMKPSAARARIRAQTSDRQRIKIADVVIDNNGTKAETYRQLQRSWDNFLLLQAGKLARTGKSGA